MAPGTHGREARPKALQPKWFAFSMRNCAQARRDESARAIILPWPRARKILDQYTHAASSGQLILPKFDRQQR